MIKDITALWSIRPHSISWRSLTFTFFQDLNRLSHLQSQTLSHRAPEVTDHCGQREREREEMKICGAKRLQEVWFLNLLSMNRLLCNTVYKVNMSLCTVTAAWGQHIHTVLYQPLLMWMTLMTAPTKQQQASAHPPTAVTKLKRQTDVLFLCSCSTFEPFQSGSVKNPGCIVKTHEASSHITEESSRLYSPIHIY